MPVVALYFDHLKPILKNVTKKQIIDNLPFLGLDIEHEDNEKIRVEYSPNRPDYSIDYGIVNGLNGLLGIKKGLIKLKIKKSNNYKINVKQNVKSVRPFITGIIAKNGTLDEQDIEQLMQMQEDLHQGIGRNRKKSSIGIHDLDKIQFPLTYTTIARNHKFIHLNEKSENSIDEILETHPKGKEYGHLLTNFQKVPIVLDSNQQTVSFPPIINASSTTVTKNTKNLFVEVTGINKEEAENMLATVATILQTAGFSLESTNISGAQNSTPKFLERKILLDPMLVNQILGLDLNTSKIISCLKKCRLDGVSKGKKIQCTIPAYRFDIFGEMDLVEEVALGYGIQNLSPTLTPSQTIGQTNSISEKIKLLTNSMVGFGFIEALNSSLTSKRILYDNSNRIDSSSISVLDSKSLEHTILRDSILPQLIENLSRNIHEPYPQKIFETGTVFLTRKEINEQFNFAGIVAHQDANYSEMKSILQSSLKTSFNLDIETKTNSEPLFEEGYCANITIKNNSVGLIGKINSKVLENYKIRVPVMGFEISLSNSIL